MAATNSGSERLDNVQGRPATPEEVARRDGYVQGRNDEYVTQNQVRMQEHTVARTQSDNSAASGLLTGLLIASMAAGIGAALYFLMGDRTNVVPVSAPQIERETVREKETTVIEREAPTPDVSMPDVQIDVPDVSMPEVNITNEAPAEAAPAEAAPAEAAPAPEAPAESEPQPAADAEAQ